MVKAARMNLEPQPLGVSKEPKKNQYLIPITMSPAFSRDRRHSLPSPQPSLHVSHLLPSLPLQQSRAPAHSSPLATAPAPPTTLVSPPGASSPHSSRRRVWSLTRSRAGRTGAGSPWRRGRDVEGKMETSAAGRPRCGQGRHSALASRDLDGRDRHNRDGRARRSRDDRARSRKGREQIRVVILGTGHAICF